MDLGLKNKRVLVTGASAGLGAAAATTLVAEGAEVVINSRNAERLKTTAKKIEETTGNRPGLAVGDVATETGRDAVIKTATEYFNGSAIDILVSNTGGPPPGAFLGHSPEKWDEAGKLLLESAVGLTRAVLPGMIDQKWGRLIYITSIGVKQPIDNLILSNSYRAAVTGFCKTISNNYACHGITANCVCPGYTATERLQSLAQKMSEESGKSVEEVLDGFTAMIPVGRVGQPEELASLITFLASDRAAYITGTSIPVDGGYYRGLL